MAPLLHLKLGCILQEMTGSSDMVAFSSFLLCFLQGVTFGLDHCAAVVANSRLHFEAEQ